MQSQRFPEFGELPLYLERLQFLGVQLASLLLFCVLVQSATYLSLRTEVPSYTTELVKNGWQRVLFTTLGPPRVGLQVGHDGAAAQPLELMHLRGNTGGHAGSLTEVAINQAVAAALATRLRQQGIIVDILGATLPEGYRADLLLALHADSVADSVRSGYKSAVFDPPRSWTEDTLKRSIDNAYLSATGLPDDTLNITSNMRHYYAFNFRRYQHSVHPATPSLIVELGYLSNADDAGLLQRPDRVAGALSTGVKAFLQQRSRLP